jgi:exopolysaccharide biosynthesis polyprenyl glycosylphosphotransferase
MKIASLSGIRQSLNSQQLIIVIFMLIPDLIAIALSALTAYSTRFSGNQNYIAATSELLQFEYRGILILIVIAWAFLLIATGTYRFNHSTLVIFNLRMIIKKSFLFFFVLGFVSFILKASFSRSVFLVMLSSGLAYIFIVRFFIYFILLRPMILNKKIASNMMIIGKGKKELEAHSEWLINNRSFGFKITSRLLCPKIESKWLEEFDRILRYKRITEVLLLPGMESDPNFSKFIHYCEDIQIHVNWIPLDSGNLGYWLIPSPQEGIPFLTFEKSEISIFWKFVKRIFDIVFSTLVILMLSPIYFLIGLSVLITSGWPVFYHQQRVGRNGKLFKFYKFRSMVKNADQLVQVQLSSNSSKRDSSKQADDPRITKVGRILRKYSLDELPQFFNVITGSMSVVGPRPAVPFEANQYSSLYERRLIAKPGITGPWQISGRSDLDLQTSISLDLNYLTNWSFTRDLWIIIATIGAVFRGKGAY